jgi:serine phosphatase RsbU (regulator of sigma subunit)
VMTDEQRAQLKKLSEIGMQMSSPSLTPQQRQSMREELRAAQTAFSESMRDSQKEFAQRLAEAAKANQQQRKATQELADQQRETARDAAEEQREAEQDAAQEKREQQMDAAEQAREQAQDQADARTDPKPARRDQQVLGRHVVMPDNLKAHLSTTRIVHRILNASPEDDAEHDEIAFAIDRDGDVYTRNDKDRQTLDNIGITQQLKDGKITNNIPNWVVVAQKDPESGVQVGVARPFGQDLEDLRRTAAKNFGYGIALIFVAMIGIIPVANHITGDVELVTRGAERIAQGDLTTRLPVHSKNEIGQLATAFNRMAEDLSMQQQRIVEQERAAIVYERKSAELEEARRFQLSMLPKEVPRLDRYDIAVFTHTATEVGGDYYDFDVDGDDVAITIGDATGHGARAGTMVAVIKALFAGYSSQETPSAFLRNATDKIRRMDLGRMAMALIVARFHEREVTIASAGMPPVYVHRCNSGSVEEVSVGATPLGTLGDDYADARIELRSGDTLLFLSDGFPELMNAAGQQFGYTAALEAFGAAAKEANAEAVIASLESAAKRWHGDQPPNDDVTFVVVRAV